MKHLTKTPVDFWILRHAKPVIEKGLCYGQLDIEADFTETQKASHDFIEKITQYYQNQKIQIILQYSPLRRCAILAEEIIKSAPFPIQAQTDHRLMEINFGYWEGKPWDDIPVAELNAWNSNFAHYCMGGAENTAQMLTRVYEAWAENTKKIPHFTQTPSKEKAILGRGCKQRSVVVWVTHLGVAHCLRWLLLHGLTMPENAAAWQDLKPSLDFGQFYRLQEN